MNALALEAISFAVPVVACGFRWFRYPEQRPTTYRAFIYVTLMLCVGWGIVISMRLHHVGL